VGKTDCVSREEARLGAALLDAADGATPSRPRIRSGARRNRAERKPALVALAALVQVVMHVRRPEPDRVPDAHVAKPTTLDEFVDRGRAHAGGGSELPDREQGLCVG
jgi:hypothetical protein